MDMAQNELATAVAAPAPVLAPILTPAPLTIPVALTGWSPSTIAELEAAGVTEVSADPRELVYRSEERRVGKECRSRWSPYH